MKLLSVNVAIPKSIQYQGETISTGIFKLPVAERVFLDVTNLQGDRQADLTVHGGQDKAVYLYPYEHYAYWQQHLQRNDFSYGQFGENFTISGLLETDVHIGDVLQIGEAKIQITQPRQPCFKLGIKMGSRDFPRTFMASGRLGFYARVLQTGYVGAGDRIIMLTPDPVAVSVERTWQLYYRDHGDIEGLKHILTVQGLSDSWRASFKQRLDRAQANSQ